MAVERVDVYVALGSNLGNREQHIIQACSDIEELSNVSDLQCSSIYETDPMGPQDQPDYLNAVCRFSLTEWTPNQLMLVLQGIEKNHGRVKTTVRWTARPLDLDILLFGDSQIDEPHLKIPHIGIAERSFVLWPLVELQADLYVPGLGEASRLMASCQKFGIQRFISHAK